MDLEPIGVRHAEENKNQASEQIEEQKISAQYQKSEKNETVQNIMNTQNSTLNQSKPEKLINSNVQTDLSPKEIAPASQAIFKSEEPVKMVE